MTKRFASIDLGQHEQSRTDRDDHIIIHWKNIMKGMTHLFKKNLF